LVTVAKCSSSLLLARGFWVRNCDGLVCPLHTMLTLNACMFYSWLCWASLRCIGDWNGACRASDKQLVSCWSSVRVPFLSRPGVGNASHHSRRLAHTRPPFPSHPVSSPCVSIIIINHCAVSNSPHWPSLDLVPYSAPRRSFLGQVFLYIVGF
jgi:hypothetical protein